MIILYTGVVDLFAFLPRYQVLETCAVKQKLRVKLGYIYLSLAVGVKQ